MILAIFAGEIFVHLENMEVRAQTWFVRILIIDSQYFTGICSKWSNYFVLSPDIIYF